MAKKAAKKRATAKSAQGKSTTTMAGLTGAYAKLQPGDIKKFISVHLHSKPRCGRGSHHASCAGKSGIDLCKVISFPISKCVCAHPKLGA